MDDEPAEISPRDAWVNRGHAIIRENLARLAQLKAQYPLLAALAPTIEATLHDLFSHLVTTPAEWDEHLVATLRTQQDAEPEAPAAPPPANSPDYKTVDERLALAAAMGEQQKLSAAAIAQQETAARIVPRDADTGAAQGALPSA